jgi:5-methylcytosine-specific restriction endonuclease McrA
MNILCAACVKSSKIHAKGLCNTCYTKQLPTILKECVNCNKDSKIIARGMCKRCYRNQPDQLEKSRSNARAWNETHPERRQANLDKYNRSKRVRPYCVLCGENNKCIHGKRMIKCTKCDNIRPNASNGLCAYCYNRQPDVMSKKRVNSLRTYHAKSLDPVEVQRRKDYDEKRRGTAEGKAYRNKLNGQHYADNPERSIKAVKYADDRRMRLLNVSGSHTAAEWRQRLDEFDNSCAYCQITDIPLTKEHVIPVVLGGISSNSIDNIVPACQPCNSAHLNYKVLVGLIFGD